MFIVTKNNPYYPNVEYCFSIEEAYAQREEWISELQSNNGEHECSITIAEVIETVEIRSDY